MTQRGGHRRLGGGGSQTPISITRCAGHPPSPPASLRGEPDSPPPAWWAARTPISITMGGWRDPRHVTFKRDPPQHHPLGSPLPRRSSSRGRLDRPPSASPGIYTHIPSPHPTPDWLSRDPPSTSLWGWRADPHPNITTGLVSNPPHHPSGGGLTRPPHLSPESLRADGHPNTIEGEPSPRGGAARPSLHHCKRGQWSRQRSPPVGLGCI